jgi:CRISPR system Cascade subunit CasD
MIAAALGRRRHESVEDLDLLRFGVRVDKEGKLLRDFHTARRDKLAYVTNRYYLSDAVFLVGLEGDVNLLAMIDDAVRYPAYPLFLGRRSCPPEGRVSLGIRPGKSLLEALQEEPLMIDKVTAPIRIVYDASLDDPYAYMLRDRPISYSSEHRKHGFRRVAELTMSIEDKTMIQHAEPPTEHDPFAEMEG